MKKLKSSILCYFILFTCSAQYKTIDSLQHLLKNEKKDTVRTRLMCEIGDEYFKKLNDSAFHFYKNSLQLSENIGYKYGELRARSILANFLFNIKSDYVSALDLNLKNIEEGESNNDTTFIFWNIREVALIYNRIGDYNKELEFVKKLRDLINSGVFKDSVKLSTYKLVTDNRFGGVYEKLNNTDSAIFYRRRVYNIGIATNQRNWFVQGSLGLADIYRNLNVKDSSFYYYRVCIPAAKKMLRTDLLSASMYGIARLFYQIQDIDSAFYYSLNYFDHAKKINSLSLMNNAASLLADIYHLNKQPDSAYKYLSLSVQLNDSILGTEKLAQIQNINLRESLQKIQLEHSKKEAIKEYQSRIKMYSLIASIIVLLSVVFILYRNSRQRKLANKKIKKAYTDLKSTQSQLIQSEKMASLGELTAGIAHEIQNPLNFVNNFSEVNKELLAEMKDEIDKGNIDEVKALANDVIDNEEKINHHGKRADAIVKGMLQHSRSSSGVKEPTDINGLCDEYLRLSYHGLRAKDKSLSAGQAGFNATMKTDFDASLEKINIIPQDIGRVVLNLITNAFYAVNEKKQQQPDGYEPTVSVSTRKIANKVEIRVNDNGNGIPQKILDKIFQPFYTTKPTGQGTGLGLSLSYDIIKAHGGELRVETKEGEGSTFIIVLPVL